jgi:hypothetical protein
VPKDVDGPAGRIGDGVHDRGDVGGLVLQAY